MIVYKDNSDGYESGRPVIINTSNDPSLRPTASGIPWVNIEARVRLLDNHNRIPVLAPPILHGLGMTAVGPPEFIPFDKIK